MLDNINLESIIFIDIETVPQYPSYNDSPERLQKLWDKKAARFCEEEETPSDVYQRAGIYAEFGKIVCISVGTIYYRDGEMKFRAKSYADDDEKKLLQDFNLMLENFGMNRAYKLCAHNGQEFDYPYIARRCLLNGLKLPKILNIAGAKPWEVKETLLDTLQLWKFGDYKNYTSLDLLCAVFDIPTPKDDIDGSQVASVYYEENDLDRIAIYCEKDIFALAQLFLRYLGRPLIEQENFESVGY